MDQESRILVDLLNGGYTGDSKLEVVRNKEDLWMTIVDEHLVEYSEFHPWAIQADNCTVQINDAVVGTSIHLVESSGCTDELTQELRDGLKQYGKSLQEIEGGDWILMIDGRVHDVGQEAHPDRIKITK